MLDFEFVTPTKYIFGRGAENRAGAAMAEMGAKRALMLYYSDPNFLKTGLVDRLRASMLEAGLEPVEMSGVVPNAKLTTVRRGVELAKSEKVDFILGIGGGSVIDSAKAIAMGAMYDGDVWDFFNGTPVKAALPVGAVVTLAAAGSESSRVSVITDEATSFKKACPSDLIRPKLAVINPEMAFTAPRFHIACGAVDIIFHILERYFTPSVDVDLTSRLMEGAMKAIIPAGKKAFDDPTDYEAQATLMWSAGWAQNDFFSCGRAKDGSCHSIEHEVGGIYDVIHGAGLTAIWPAWAKYCMSANVPRFVQFAVRVWGCELDVDRPENTALEGIEKFTEYMRYFGLPTTLTELGLPDIPEETLREMALKGTNDGKSKLGGLKVLDVEDIVNILKLAN